MKKHTNWKWWIIALLIALISIIGILIFLYFTNRLDFLLNFELKSLWVTFKIWEKITLLFGVLIYPIFVNWISDYIYNRIFPSDTTRIIDDIDKAKSEIIKEIQKSAVAQGLTKTNEELLKVIEELKAKLPKGIDKKLEEKIEKLFDDLQFEGLRNLIDDFISNNEIKQKDLAKLHFQKALAYEAEMSYPKAKEQLETAIALNKTEPFLLHQYACILFTLSEYEKAINYYKIVLKLRDDNDPGFISTVYHNIGLAMCSMGKFSESINYYKNALKMHQDVEGGDSDFIPITYSDIGEAMRLQGKYKQAITYQEKALKLRVENPDENQINSAIIYNNMGLAWYSYSDYDKAIKFCEKALKINLNVLRNDHPEIANNYTNIGSAWKSKSEYNKAFENYEKALKIQLKVYNDKHPRTALTYNNIGSVWHSIGEHDRAIENYENALKILSKIYPDGHPNISDITSNLELARLEKNK